MKNSSIPVLLIIISTSLVCTKETGPYLVIQDVDNPQLLIKPPIEVSPGQNLTLKCYSNTYNDHSVFWTWKNKQLKTSDGVLKLHGLSKTDEGSYLCVSAKTKLTKEVQIIIVKTTRVKRYDDDIYQLPPGPIHFEDVLKMNEEFLKRHPVDSWGNSASNPHEIEDWLDDYHEKQEQRRSRNRNIGIAVGGVVAIICMLVIVCVVCKRMNNQNPTVATYAPPSVGRPNANNRESRPLNAPPPDTHYRPIETHIPPYPPPTAAVPPPIQYGFNGTVAKVPNSECLPPPSYDEALNNAGPSAPPVCKEHSNPTAPEF